MSDGAWSLRVFSTPLLNNATAERGPSRARPASGGAWVGCPRDHREGARSEPKANVVNKTRLPPRVELGADFGVARFVEPEAREESGSDQVTRHREQPVEREDREFHAFGLVGVGHVAREVEHEAGELQSESVRHLEDEVPRREIR